MVLPYVTTTSSPTFSPRGSIPGCDTRVLTVERRLPLGLYPLKWIVPF